MQKNITHLRGVVRTVTRTHMGAANRGLAYQHHTKPATCSTNTSKRTRDTFKPCLNDFLRKMFVREQNILAGKKFLKNRAISHSCENGIALPFQLYIVASRWFNVPKSRQEADMTPSFVVLPSPLKFLIISIFLSALLVIGHSLRTQCYACTLQ